jgi:hypothetical protein
MKGYYDNISALWSPKNKAKQSQTKPIAGLCLEIDALDIRSTKL